jgi:hypothetical protein
MIALDTRRQQVEDELSASPAPEPVRLRLGMPEVYRAKVGELTTSLADPTHNVEATAAIRALVDRIVLTPSAEEPRLLTVDLEGVLAQFFRPGLSAANMKAASLGETASMQSELVAGAGYNEERTDKELRLAV